MHQAKDSMGEGLKIPLVKDTPSTFSPSLYEVKIYIHDDAPSYRIFLLKEPVPRRISTAP